jgi:hypothetical protein
MLFLMIPLLIGCDNSQKWIGNEDAFNFFAVRAKPATIETCQFKNGRLTVNGSCSAEGEPILIFPETKGDNRIIGSPKCTNGRYGVITSRFGRPPCRVVLDYGGDKIINAKVEGSELYCN